MKTGLLLLLIALIISIGITGCTKLDSAEQSLVCGVSDPINELSWLREQYEMIKDIPESGIIFYRYDSKEIIEVQSSLMSSTNLSQYYCDGTKLEFNTPETYNNHYQDFLSKRIQIKILYGIDLWKL